MSDTTEASAAERDTDDHADVDGSQRDQPMALATGELSRIVLADEPLEAILGRIVDLAKQLLPAAADISVTLVDKDSAATAAFTGALALAMDERQYDVDHGPCLSAARTGEEYHIQDTRTEIRWPDYTLRAVAAGVLSSLSIPLPVHAVPIGALNIYSLHASGFDDADAEAARTFAGYAAIALHNAKVFAATTALAAQMRTAMESRAVIEQAKGILMGQRRIAAGEAFQILRSLSQTSNRKLRDVAQAIVDLAENPAAR